MVFSLVRCFTGQKKPSQDNAEYINSGIVSWPNLITSGATLLGITMNSTLGTKNDVKVFSFVDNAERPGVKRADGHPQRGPTPKGATRAATGRPTTDRNSPL